MCGLAWRVDRRRLSQIVAHWDAQEPGEEVGYARHWFALELRMRVGWASLDCRTHHQELEPWAGQVRVGCNIYYKTKKAVRGCQAWSEQPLSLARSVVGSENGRGAKGMTLLCCGSHW